MSSTEVALSGALWAWAAPAIRRAAPDAAARRAGRRNETMGMREISFSGWTQGMRRILKARRFKPASVRLTRSFRRAEISHIGDGEQPANAAPRSGWAGLKAWRLRRVDCDETRRYCGAKTASGIEITSLVA